MPSDSYWGGINAAEILTDYILADKTEIYTGMPFQEVMKTLKIVPDDHGEIKLIEKFWSYEEKEGDIIDPFLIYADLINNSNPRYIEAANLIYKAYVQAKLRCIGS